MSDLYIIRHIESGAVRQMGDGQAAVFYRRDAAEKHLAGAHGYKICVLRLSTPKPTADDSAAAKFLKDIFGNSTGARP